MTHPALLAADAPDLAPGLRDLGLLRRGEALDVHDAWHRDMDCRCVVKTLRPDRAGDASAADALRMEGARLIAFAHPHLVRAFALVEAGRPMLVLETLDGRTLDGLIEDEDGLHPDDMRELGSQLASALAYLHGHGVLHLDLKPSNIVCTAGAVRLIDLSVARAPGAGRAGVGTDGYMAPEQERGAAVSAATDVFGLAGVLIEASTTEPPPAAGAAPVWPRRRRPPRPVRDALAACRAADPARRPALGELTTVLRGGA
ncbi:MAG: serine/threonine protein kinase [Thermoleophilia bacterium]|nr:serine/threonine protein kinase [Thermoleophilia bacterium]